MGNHASARLRDCEQLARQREAERGEHAPVGQAAEERLAIDRR